MYGGETVHLSVNFLPATFIFFIILSTFSSARTGLFVPMHRISKAPQKHLTSERRNKSANGGRKRESVALSPRTFEAQGTMAVTTDLQVTLSLSLSLSLITNIIHYFSNMHLQYLHTHTHSTIHYYVHILLYRWERE